MFCAAKIQGQRESTGQTLRDKEDERTNMLLSLETHPAFRPVLV